MKKFFYMIAFVFAASLTITACTEEEVQPSMENGNAGAGVVIDPKG